MSVMSWLPMKYRDFYDVPRAFVAEREGQLYFFDCPFDTVADDYPEYFTVYLLPNELAMELDTISWESLASRGHEIGRVPAKSVSFDPTKRRLVNDGIFGLLLESQ